MPHRNPAAPQPRASPLGRQHASEAHACSYRPRPLAEGEAASTRTSTDQNSNEVELRGVEPFPRRRRLPFRYASLRVGAAGKGFGSDPPRSSSVLARPGRSGSIWAADGQRMGSGISRAASVRQVSRDDFETHMPEVDLRQLAERRSVDANGGRALPHPMSSCKYPPRRDQRGRGTRPLAELSWGAG